MTNTGLTVKWAGIAVLCFGILACASTPAPDQRPEILQSAEKSLELGVSNYLENNFDKAEAHFSRALFLYRNIDNPDGITSSCINLAKTHLSSGQIENARTYATMAQTIIQREKLSAYNDRLTLIQSSIAIESGIPTEAKQLIDTLLKKTATLNDDAIRTAALQNRTRLAFISKADDTASWVNEYEAALTKPGQNTPLNQARLLRFQATLQPDNRAEKLGKALSLYRQAAHGPGIAATLSEWAAYDALANQHSNAIEKLQRALFIRANLRDRKNSREILQQMATSYHQLGDTSRAQQSRHWLQQLDNPAFAQWDALISM